MRRAFVAGATGYTGRAVVFELRRRGYDVIAHVRPGSKSWAVWGAALADSGARPLEIPWHLVDLSSLLKKECPDVVFALLGTTRARAKSEGVAGDIYEQVDYGVSAMLVDAVLGANISPRFVYLSSLGAKDGARNKYLAARGKMEKKLRNSGIDYTIARPSFISGSDRAESRPMERVGAIVSDALLKGVATLGGRRVRKRYRSIDATSLARVLVDASESPLARNQVLCGEEWWPDR
jgi:uncharacterized protein YbjT (DUF2867 family)